MLKSNPETWKNIALQHQGIGEKHIFSEGVKGVENALNTLGYIQIDTLYVIERAHHHSLWNRVKDYQLSDLDELVAQRKAFEHWHHALSYLPMQDYRFSIPFMKKVKAGEISYYKERDQKLMQSIIERIKIDGPIKLRDLKDENAPAKKGVWNSRPAKKALEILFLQGDLMVAGREKMERIYDQTENVLPSDISTESPTLTEYADYLIDTTLRANGFATLKYILHGKSTAVLKKQTQASLDQRINDGQIECHETDFMPPVYALKGITEKAHSNTLDNVKILSPFDNAIINRDRAEDLFDFPYRLECYTPAAKRQFGYFCLPILYGNKIIGRMDCKVDRKEGVFNIQHFHIEKEIPDLDAFLWSFAKETMRFANFNQCHSVNVQKTSPAKHKALLKRTLKTIS